MRILFEGSERTLRYKKDPSRHYVLVHRGGKAERDPVQEFLDSGYRIESEDKEVTSSSQLVLMSIEKEIWEASEMRRVKYNTDLLLGGQAIESPDSDESLADFGGGGRPKIEVKPPEDFEAEGIVEIGE